MSKHWKPSGKIVRIRPVRGSRLGAGKRLRSIDEFRAGDVLWRRAGKWTRPEAYGARRGWRKPSLAVPVLLGAVLIGLLAGQALHWREGASNGAAEWVPPKPEILLPDVKPDAADAEWERRAQAPLGPAEVVQPGSAPASIHVIDGDTFVLGRQKVRIANIDAPELHPPRCMEEARLGLAATEALRALLAGGEVTLMDSGSDHDEHGRLLRLVSVGGQDVGEAMIASGLARPYGSGRQAWC